VRHQQSGEDDVAANDGNDAHVHELDAEHGLVDADADADVDAYAHADDVSPVLPVLPGAVTFRCAGRQ
jgi:hypothetical protein